MIEHQFNHIWREKILFKSVENCPDVWIEPELGIVTVDGRYNIHLTFIWRSLYTL